MTARILCASLHGVRALRVDLEVDLHRGGMPSFSLVGLADAAIREARERVMAALRNSAYKIPPARITVNLAPADRRKDGSAYDLPLAVGLLCASGFVGEEAGKDLLFAGELSLTGELVPVSGILPVAVLARELGCKGLFVPEENAAEAAVVESLQVFPARSLSAVVAHLRGEESIRPALPVANLVENSSFPFDFAEVKGQEQAKRAIEIAAAGGHNLLLVGPPGSGKTMLAQRIPSILPPLDFEESLEVSTIYSVAGLLLQSPGQGLLRHRPFRSPHHTVSYAGLVGGGTNPRPGEVSLAHRGVLFLDELPEYQKHALETLRQPLEDGKIAISRVSGNLSFPADFMLVASMNPCPCGYLGDSRKSCTCSPAAVKRYAAKLSGPLLDRIDLHVEVPAVDQGDLLRQGDAQGESSAVIRERITRARLLQNKRYATWAAEQPGAPLCRTNADLSGSSLDRFCELEATGRAFLGNAVSTLSLSARAYTRILRIARTIADMAEVENITVEHLAEAINCRLLDRQLP